MLTEGCCSDLRGSLYECMLTEGCCSKGTSLGIYSIVCAEVFLLYTVSGVTHFLFHVVMHNTKEDGDFPPEDNESTKVQTLGMAIDQSMS